MFAGIGGFRAGLTRAGGFHCVGHCEIDKYADRSYRAMHDIQPEEYFCSDAKAMKSCEIPDIDLICGGFPCQAYPEEMAIAGKRLEALRRKASSKFVRDDLFVPVLLFPSQFLHHLLIICIPYRFDRIILERLQFSG